MKRTRALKKTLLSTLVLLAVLLLGFVLRGRLGLRFAILASAVVLVLGLQWVDRRFRDPWR